MICVIADDLSGAAEIGGVAWQAGLSAQIFFRAASPSSADLVVVDTDSRSCSSSEARRRIVTAVASLPSDAEWVFKKVDSVLRGNVLAEIVAWQTQVDQDQTLLVPANPGHGRTIRQGQVFVGGRPLIDTPFAHDPEHPARSSLVAELLGTKSVGSQQTPPATLLEAGIVVPDIDAPDDLERWARRCPPSMLAAGGAEFFESLLAARWPDAPQTHREEVPLSLDDAPRRFFVCGSPTAWNEMRREQTQTHGIPVVRVSDSASETDIRLATTTTLRHLERDRFAMLALGEYHLTNVQDVLTPLNRVAVSVLAQLSIQQVMVEGGATAAELLRTLECHSLSVSRQYAPGVVAVRGEGLDSEFVLKPGSYDWPPGLLPPRKNPD